jgi:hypothetical protein
MQALLKGARFHRRGQRPVCAPSSLERAAGSHRRMTRETRWTRNRRGMRNPRKGRRMTRE